MTDVAHDSDDLRPRLIRGIHQDSASPGTPFGAGAGRPVRKDAQPGFGAWPTFRVRSFARVCGSWASSQSASCRKETQLGRFRNPYVGDSIRYCGFYTQNEIRDVVAYAKTRHVTIVPVSRVKQH